MTVRPFILSAIAAAAGAGGVADGAIMSVTIRGATPLDPAGDGGGPSGSGWVADVVLKGIASTSGALDASKLVLVVTDPGYDGAGAVAARSRTIRGVSVLRQQYPASNSYLVTTAAGNLSLSISLDDWIYSGSTVFSAAIEAGFYTGSVASTSPTNTNGSVEPYPRAVFGWVTCQHERATAATFGVEGVAFHRHPMGGRPVACVEYITTAGSTFSNSLTTSTVVTQGFVPEVFAASIPVSGLTQGAVSSVNAKIYPWIGDSSAVFDLAVHGKAWPTSEPQTPLRVLVDSSGGYGGAYAYVKVGASGGTVSATPATAAAAPFPTLTAAFTALAAWNNTNRGHNDHSGSVVRLMDADGSASTHTIAASNNTTAGLCWTRVEKDPASTAAVTVTASGIFNMPSLVKYCGGLIVKTGSAYSFSVSAATANSMVCLESISFDNVGGYAEIGAYTNLMWQYNVTLTSGHLKRIAKLTASQVNTVIQAGVVCASSSSSNIEAHSVIGCNVGERYTEPTSANIGTDTCDGTIIYNNRFRAGMSVGKTSPAVRGYAIVQNLVESPTAVTQCISFAADGTTQSINNFIEMYNTAVGERSSQMYNDVPATDILPSGLRKVGTAKYNVWDNYNIKGDTFQRTSGNAAGVGNWSCMYQVGNAGNISLFGSVNRGSSNSGGSDAPNNDGFDGYLGMSWLPSSNYNLQHTRAGWVGMSKPDIMALFSGYTVAPQASPAVGGAYTLVGASSPLYGCVPSGLAALGKDLAGVARLNDGSGAAGAYERTA